ncbi:hypothetical protein [Lentimicrobium sp.]|uniref:DUF6913 domain-containing protein n=2 Tax=Lentimicrobium sp. TaxID=2034841 RepID=UPI002BA45F34|nr:hypothetical protein [Lentimicrobium sp.]HPJ63023.1 hypothetical protein [Lentimicrobium sp.]
MSLIRNLRIAFGKRALRKEAARNGRMRRAVNLAEARDVGILFNMTSETEYDRVSRFARSLQEQGKKVQVIGFYKYQKLPPYYAQKLAYDIMQPQHLDLFYRPKVGFVTHFINHPFDMLIDLGITDEFPLYYIAVLSKAGFKLGRRREAEAGIIPYDLMIEAKQETDSEELIRHLIYYTSSFRFNG